MKYEVFTNTIKKDNIMSKNLFTFLIAVLFTATVFLPQQAIAQAPEKISYQAVIRNTSDQLVKNTLVGMKIRIQNRVTLKLYQDIYVETHKATTNENGLITIQIGAGTEELGDFSTIEWGNGVTYYLYTECDPAGGSNYTISERTQLQSVPYALYAKTSGNGSVWIKNENDIKYEAGNVTVTKELNQTSTGNANMMPFAYGYVSETSTLVSGTSNVGKITELAVGQYEVEIAGLGTDYIVIATPSGCSTGLHCVVSARNNVHFMVAFYNSISKSYNSAAFSFIVYKP